MGTRSGFGRPEGPGFFGGAVAVAVPESCAFLARAESVGRSAGCGAVAVATARRAGASSLKPRTASTRNIAAAAQPGDRRESKRSERPGKQDRRACAMA